MRWEDVPVAVDEWLLKVAATGYDVRQEAVDVVTGTDVGYYCSPGSGLVAVYAPAADAGDRLRVKRATERAVGPSGVRPLFLTGQELAHPDSDWVKVAYSTSLRRAGELLNFFPGQYPGGLPNAPSPLAAMLTTGLLGAGLGWGAGKLGKRVLPPGYGDNLPRAGMLLGAGLGAAPGAAWAGTNKLTGRPLNDPTLLKPPAGAGPIDYPWAVDGSNAVVPPDARLDLHGLDSAVEQLHTTVPHRLKASLDKLTLHPMYKAAVAKEASTWGVADRREPSSADVNINHLGQTLWDLGASPQTAATTMGAMYAAHQLPDPGARPGWVTGRQLGQLAANAAGDFATGVLVGTALNATVGTPYKPGAFGAGAATLGVIAAVVPKLFGG
jgi:hypothetical protein